MKLKLVKVKSHSGNWKNDTADTLAKWGSNCENFLISVNCPDTSFSLQSAQWKGNTIDIPIRKFINIKNKLSHQASWSLNSNVRGLIVTGGQKSDFVTTWATLKKYRGIEEGTMFLLNKIANIYSK